MSFWLMSNEEMWGHMRKFINDHNYIPENLKQLINWVNYLKKREDEK